MLDKIPKEIRKSCLQTVYKICGRQALLPRSLLIPLCYDPTSDALCHGGFADVWKGKYQGRDIAAKVLRVYQKDFDIE